MIFSDHLNFQGTSPLAGFHDPRWGARFVDMTRAYDPSLRLCALKAGRALRLKCFQGVYAALLGPTYETPAEIRALRTLGADAVGMSTVPEVIAVRQMGVRALAVAIITNRAAGLSRKPLSHKEVLKTGQAASGDLGTPSRRRHASPSARRRTTMKRRIVRSSTDGLTRHLSLLLTQVHELRLPGLFLLPDSFSRPHCG